MDEEESESTIANTLPEGSDTVTDEEIVFSYRDFEVSDFEGDADGIEGTLSASQVDYPGSGDFVSVIVACFDENGTVSGSWTVVIEDVVEPGSNTKISTQPDNGVSDCDRFLVAAGDL